MSLHRGNKFKHRVNFATYDAALSNRYKNPYNVFTENSSSTSRGPLIQDRVDLLREFTRLRIRILFCTLCYRQLDIYDEYPLIDGVLFETHGYYYYARKIRKNNTDICIIAVCVRCLMGRSGGVQLTCKSCNTVWNGCIYIMGVVYKYDIFAAMICCNSRKTCLSCKYQINSELDMAKYYSNYSKEIACPLCKAIERHFIKPIHTIYNVKQIP